MSVDGGFEIEMNHYSDMGSEVVLIMNADVAGELAMVLDPLDSGWRDLSMELLEAVIDIDRTTGCDHRWTAAPDESARGKRICLKCMRMLKGSYEANAAR